MGERPRVWKTEGIVLRRRNIGEADSIFTIYADREGKFDAIAKGVRKVRSHMRGHIEPLMRTRVMLAQGRTLDVLTQAEVVQAYRNIREDLSRGADAMYCAELVDRFTIEHGHNPGVFGWLAAVLDALEAGSPHHVLRQFELQMLALAGYELQLDGCGLCGARLPEEETLFSTSAGGLLCVQCRPSGGTGRMLTVRAVKVMRFARVAGCAEFAALRVSPDLDAELRAALGSMVHAVLERQPLTERYVDEIAALDRRTFTVEAPTGVQFTATNPGP
ncbi:hypothetical protein AYO38_06690 [bacterium SCGC AG-212-C10]|nr:hypothetical protein AYO38_06690 [bacterium SCGC AG-212-C10]